MAELPRQFVLVLDLQRPLAEAALDTQLPSRRWDVRTFKLSERLARDALEAARETGGIDFDAASRSAAALVRDARQEADSLSSRPVHWFVVGSAPLPLFSQVGLDLSAWAKPVTLLNQRKDGTWDQIEVGGSSAAGPKVFDQVSGLDGRFEASGRLAVFVSTMGNAAPREALRSYLEDRGDALAGLVELRTAMPILLTRGNGSAAAEELATHFSKLAASYPYALSRGLAVFVSGPASLAFLVGRAVNRNIVREAWFPNFSSGDYVDGVTVPLPDSPTASLDFSQAAVEIRSGTREKIRRAFEQLKVALRNEHLPESPMLGDPQRFIGGLRDVAWSDDSPVDGFALKILQRRLAIGDSLVESLRQLADDALAGVTSQLVVHELFHNFQDLTQANYRQIGRAGVVLEEIDFWADAFSVAALCKMRASTATPAAALQTEIEHLLSGIEAFDRAEQGEQLHRLYERRLRRYLIWYLQQARAATLRPGDGIEAMLANRLIVELVPTAGSLDDRGDKFVRRATDRTQLVVLCDGHLARFPRDEDLSPSDLVDDVRHFRRQALKDAMERVVGKQQRLLAPWAAL